jgi:MYXO-CTERM domain-containing protein
LALAPIFLIGLALPLLAPSCGDFQPGVKTFAKGSLIIPMDLCYQCTRQSADGLDTATANCTRTGYVSSPSNNQCPQALAQGDVLKAYGLVYQLIRNDVPVYWTIDPQKGALDAYDFAIQYNGGFPVSRLDWATGLPGANPTAAATIKYMGGPFVIDGSDAAKALAVMQANRTTFSAVNVHVSSVAFQAPVAKTMAGGWGAGDTVPPKLALLNIGSGNLTNHGTQATCTGPGDTSHSCDSTFCIGSSKNAEPVIEGYLAKAGIGSGAAGGTATGVHGQIYDRLTVADFIPGTPGDWTTTNLYRNGYQVLWVPHWVAPGSCTAAADGNGNIGACACLASRITPAQVDAILQTIGQFSRAGHDVFAECAGLGSFEGAFSGLTGTSYTVDYSDGDPSTRFQTKTGVRYNQLPTSPFPAASFSPDAANNFASPLLQIGDFPFKPYTGAVEDYKPDDTGNADRNYQPGVTRLIGTKYTSGSPAKERDWDFFTLRSPDTAASTRHGTIVYLSGHSYSGVQGSFQAGGSRLVINTLFNLGASCTSSGVACDTGQRGACSKGILTCDPGGRQVCSQTVFPQAETCNGIDDDCNGLVDENLEQGCYDGPAGTRGVGVCLAGVKTCQQGQDGSYGFSSCQGQVLPSSEVCNGLDDDCDGVVDDLAAGPPVVPLTEPCYSGPPSTDGVGVCRAGSRTCTSGSWGVCLGEVTPIADPCGSPEGGTTATDRDCDGAIDACGTCTPGTTRNCYDGPAGTDGVGLCHHGTQTCNALGQWSATCAGEQPPQDEICNDGLDQGCHGDVTGRGKGHDGPPWCNACRKEDDKVACWSGPASAVFKDAAHPQSVCLRGSLECVAGQLGGCAQQTLPGPELCNGKDDDCNGLVDDGAQCGAGFACENGVCVYSACAPEVSCQAGYDCIGGHCKLSTCGSSGTLVCPAGQACDAESGRCIDPCDPAKIQCGAGSTCAGGYCTGGACYAVGCPGGQLCRAGACVPDACSGVICPAGSFCREGDCVQSCAFRSCGGGEMCSVDGFCVADPCAGKACGASQTCLAGACVADACLGIACDAKQRCSGGVCVDNPCNGITCGVGECRDGQCYAVHAPSKVSGAGSSSKGGCGCGSGESSPLAFLGLLLALPLARRRRRAPGAALLVALAGLGLAATGCKKSSTTFDPAACAQLKAPLATCEGESRCIDLYNDPSHCGTCGKACSAGSFCADGACGPSSEVAPHIASVNPGTAGAGGLTPVPITVSGERFVAGATLRATSEGGATTLTAPGTVSGSGTLTAQLDLSSAPTGAWTLRVVNPDLIISNGKTFGVVVPTPAVSRVVPIPDASPGASPPQVAAGGARTLRLEGSGFMQTSTCRLSGGTLGELATPATLTAAGLECRLDLTSVQPGDYQVWVVNDASHLSGHSPFRVVSAQPTLATLSPSGARYNTTPAVQLFGTGFDITSKVWFSGTGFADVPEATTFVDSTRLIVGAVDLQHCPGAPCPTSDASHRYDLQVRNGALVSEKLELIVDAQTRAVSTMDPASAWQGDQPRVTIQGSGLSGAVLESRPPGGSFLPSTQPQATDTAVSGVVDLVGSPAGTAPAGSWDVRLRFPSGATSASFSLRVDSNRAVITATPAPAGGEAGQTVPVTLSVSNLRPPQAGVVVRFFDPAPGATFKVDLTPTFPSAGQVVASLPLQGLHTGVYGLSVVNPNGAAASDPYNFTVLPGTPRLDGAACQGPLCASPSSAHQQAQPVPIRITGANFAKADAAGNNGSQVRVSAPALGIVDQLVPPASVTVTSATQIDVLLDTTLAIPSATRPYSLQVWNQGGALRSNVLADAFTILP